MQIFAWFIHCDPETKLAQAARDLCHSSLQGMAVLADLIRDSAYYWCRVLGGLLCRDTCYLLLEAVAQATLVYAILMAVTTCSTIMAHPHLIHFLLGYPCVAAAAAAAIYISTRKATIDTCVAKEATTSPTEPTTEPTSSPADEDNHTVLKLKEKIKALKAKVRLMQQKGYEIAEQATAAHASLKDTFAQGYHQGWQAGHEAGQQAEQQKVEVTKHFVHRWLPLGPAQVDLNDFGVQLFNLRRLRVTDEAIQEAGYSPAFVWHSAAGKLLRAGLMAELSVDELRNLYKRLALAVHPDKCTTEQEKMVATMEMQALGWAKQVLQVDGPVARVS
eukprot:gene5209-5447_t